MKDAVPTCRDGSLVVFINNKKGQPKDVVVIEDTIEKRRVKQNGRQIRVTNNGSTNSNS